MAAHRDLPLLMICLLLIRGSSPLPTSDVQPRGPTTDDLPPDDYYENLEPTTANVPVITIPPIEGGPEKCDYNPCLEDQVPCSILKATTGCLCQGVTLHNVAPLAPDVKSVSWNGSEVEIKWCAPYSHVTAYIVTVGGEHRRKFSKDNRRGGLGEVENHTQVCVVAANDAGQSEESCMMYQPSDSNLPLKAGLIGGALGLLLLLLLAVLLWRHRRQRKQGASISMNATAGSTQ